MELDVLALCCHMQDCHMQENSDTGQRSERSTFLALSIMTPSNLLGSQILNEPSTDPYLRGQLRK